MKCVFDFLVLLSTATSSARKLGVHELRASRIIWKHADYFSSPWPPKYPPTGRTWLSNEECKLGRMDKLEDEYINYNKEADKN